MKKNFIINLPGVGRFAVSRERFGEALRFGAEGLFHSNLTIEHRDKRGRLIERRDLGSGLTTNVGALVLANDFAWTATNALNSLFAKLKYHASGIGTTAAAATDIKLQTVSAQGGQTPVAGTQVLVS